jgi:hypothetical protein
MLKYSQIISLGSNCAPGLSLRELNLKGETFPFDWIVSSPEIIYDICKNGPEKFLTFSSESTNLITRHFFEQLFKNSIQDFPHKKCLKNVYGQYFTHYIGQSQRTIKTKFNRYIERFFNVLKTSTDILFIHSSEEYVYHKMSRENTENNYNHLVLFSEWLHAYNPLLNFKILNVEINNKYQNTYFIDNINMEYDLDFSDNCEYHDGEHYSLYRNTLTSLINSYIAD